MRIEESRQHNAAWIPWILALVVLLGVDAVGLETSQSRLNDTTEGVGMSNYAKVVGAPGRAADPLVLGAPAPPIDAALHDPGCTFLKLQTPEHMMEGNLRQGSVRGRAPPVAV